MARRGVIQNLLGLAYTAAARPLTKRSADGQGDLHMIRKNDFGGIAKLAEQIREERQRKKMDKCMEMFENYAICTQTTSFYLWAQMLARDMMKDGGKATETI